MQQTNQYIIDYSNNNEICGEIHSFGIIQYHLPMIQCYVIEISESQIEKLKGVCHINSIQKTVRIKTQII